MTLAGRRRAVVEDMAEMPAAAAAVDLDPLHEQRPVQPRADGARERIPEARPAGAGIEFRLRRIGGEIAARAMKNALPVLLQQRAGAGALGGVLAEHGELRLVQDLPPFGVRPDDIEDFRPRRAGEARQGCRRRGGPPARNDRRFMTFSPSGTLAPAGVGRQSTAVEAPRGGNFSCCAGPAAGTKPRSSRRFAGTDPRRPD